MSDTVIETFCESVFQLSSAYNMTPEQRVKAAAGILYAFASKDTPYEISVDVEE